MISRRDLLGGIAGFLPLFLLGSAGQAWAIQSFGESPKVVARSYGPMPADRVIAVTFDKTNDLNLWIRATMVADLEFKGYEIRDDAPLILHFRSQLRSDQDSGSRFSLHADRGDQSP